ncbi:hypothetical protein ZIOFF_074248 [Zingiber officinale]|uniref:RING-CH-type domain-containing protein n=1 Tax=Zingiber officinale TaxID=94328 RepID=A0A8J5BZU5_ZINOF|nr:hypothetical protein ZIOFF_074248 [Zingiber officinale]
MAVSAALISLLLLVAFSSPLAITAGRVVVRDGTSCTMCASCDDPCQPIASPPPPSPPPPSPTTYECPPPPSDTPGTFYYYSPPPPSAGGSGNGGGYYYSPPTDVYYNAPPPPNPFLPYFPSSSFRQHGKLMETDNRAIIAASLFEEEERSTAMESPCACSGTLKRWCYEKGSVVCEICLQNFEPGYTVNQKKALVDVEVTIRGSLEVPRINYDPRNPEFVYVNDDGDSDYAECSPASSFRVSNLVGVMTAGEDHYAFTILTVFLLRASGILLPLYLVMRFIAALQEAEQEDNLQQQQLQYAEGSYKVINGIRYERVSIAKN